MKFTAASYLLIFSCITAAAIPVVLEKNYDGVALSNVIQRQEIPTGLPVGTTIQLLSRAPGQEGVESQHIRIGQTSRIHHPINDSPFSRSSIVRAETRASTVDGEPEGAIVESEINCRKEPYIRIPCFSGNTPDYQGAQIHTDVIVVALVLSFVAVVLIIELWNPVAARISYFQSGHGPIYLDTKREANRVCLL
ncbi:hypothetical protein F4861DRAFT_265023 [Xylaria intraflava]|nr:hypothetical protein F4861DRAFT_265023 [Xylaria intraflava]